jgi:hypothetical protein
LKTHIKLHKSERVLFSGFNSINTFLKPLSMYLPIPSCIDFHYLIPNLLVVVISLRLNSGKKLIPMRCTLL